MDIYVYEIKTQGAAAGTWSKNTLDIGVGILRQIYLAVGNSNVTFDFKLTDEASNDIYDTVRREKTATQVLDDEVCIPVHGIYTMKVYNASSNGITFSGRLLVED